MVKIDVSKEIRRAVDTGKVTFGTKMSEKNLKNGSGKLIIIANNTPGLVKEKLLSFAEIGNTVSYIFEESGIELGSVCGKPFPVSVMIIEDAGKSKVLEITK